jgi:hypothetical protein
VSSILVDKEGSLSTFESVLALKLDFLKLVFNSLANHEKNVQWAEETKKHHHSMTFLYYTLIFHAVTKFPSQQSAS